MATEPGSAFTTPAETLSIAPTVKSWHAHVYFDQGSLPLAQKICETARDVFPVTMGGIHQKFVGPHPMWSCQLAFADDKFACVVRWLNMHRSGLTVFVHPNTGDALGDHRDRAIWLGDSATLKLSVFED